MICICSIYVHVFICKPITTLTDWLSASMTKSNLVSSSRFVNFSVSNLAEMHASWLEHSEIFTPIRNRIFLLVVDVMRRSYPQSCSNLEILNNPILIFTHYLNTTYIYSTVVKYWLLNQLKVGCKVISFEMSMTFPLSLPNAFLLS